jgi:hypothetical protein
LAAESPITVGPDGSKWIREGECSGCGQCCLGDPFNGSEGPAEVDGYCPLARLAGDKIRCAGYGVHPYYLRGCNVFPQFPEQIADKPLCTYTFQRVG